MWKVSSLLSRIRIANVALGYATCIEGNIDRVRSWHYGELELSNGKLLGIYPRWWPRHGSWWEAFQDGYMRALESDRCRVYYAFPRSAPGFMSVLYARSGPGTQYKTLLRAVEVVDEIARLGNAKAIVCQVVSIRATERLMNRWGYVRHATILGDNHYIKRFN